MTLILMINRFHKIIAISCLVGAAALTDSTAEVYLEEAPDYSWYAGCFGTANGNLMGFWDRSGFPNLYTGPTNGGVAPLKDVGNLGIRSMWASAQGHDGRPSNQPGHMDDYVTSYRAHSPAMSYQDTGPDPYEVEGREEHEPDCIGDFIGLSQNKWQNMNGECNGNIDAYSFVYWDAAGEKRINHIPDDTSGPPVDIQSGLRSWVEYRGYQGDVFTQLAEFNPNVPDGKGFTFEDLMAEIDAGYPVMVFLQRFDRNSRTLQGTPDVNPEIHGMFVYGYGGVDNGDPFVRFRDSWAGGVRRVRWGSQVWVADLPVRGIIGFRPLPKIMNFERRDGKIRLEWHAPAVELTDTTEGTTRRLHYYVVEKSVDMKTFTPVGPPTELFEAELDDCCDGNAFYRVRLVHADDVE